jgi:hypothetical protein
LEEVLVRSRRAVTRDRPSALHTLDPLSDERWRDFVWKHPKASVFHNPEWLEALRSSYGYRPIVYTTSPPGAPLTNGIVICCIDSWLTGSRLVSLPFSDHCDPLVDDSGDLITLLSFLTTSVDRDGYDYLELRPLSLFSYSDTLGGSVLPSKCFYVHVLDLQPSLDELFKGFHRSCVQRRIRKAEKESLFYEQGRSEELLTKFYQLLLLTRRRHQLPPQPVAWFRNLIACMGESLNVRVASKNGQAIAAILTLAHKDTIVYKYGCSDAKFHNLGGMQLLMWQAIQDAKLSCARCFDFGRSECDDEGLVAFKDHWGGMKRLITYYRYPAQVSESPSHWGVRSAKAILKHLPGRAQMALGWLFYRHAG